MKKNQITANILSQFLQKEFVATIVGASMLILLILINAVAMYKGFPTSDASKVLENAFLLILGYFFGQTASKSTASPSLQKTE